MEIVSAPLLEQEANNRGEENRVSGGPRIMPVEAILPLIVFGSLLSLWVVLPGRPGEDDYGSRIRNLLLRRKDDS